MPNPRIRTSSDAASHWEGRIIASQQGLIVTLDGRELPAVACPPLDSLQRRYEGGDRSWLASWMADDVDPTQPE